MTAFLSTYVNRVDRKGRVSVPAPFRAALANATYQGLIVYPSLKDNAIEAFGRDMLEQLNSKRLDQSLDGGDFERILLGGGDGIVETIMAMVHELPFDGEGRIVLPPSLMAEVGIDDRATFVGRGNRFQIWAPEAFEEHQRQAREALRARLTDGNPL